MKDFIKGDTVEKQLASVNRVLNSFSRRLTKTVVGVIPPSLASQYIEVPAEDGILLRWIFPPGTLTYGFMAVEEFNVKTAVKFEAELVGGESTAQKVGFETRSHITTVKPNIRVETGARLIFRVLDPTAIRKIWSGFLFQIDAKFDERERFAISALEEKIGEEINLEVI